MFNFKFVDIHTHLLPIQDGPDDIEQAVRAISIAEECNISKIILTPHYISGDVRYNRSDVLNLFRELKEETLKKELGVELYLGNECVIDDKIIEDIKEGRVLTLGGTRYILCEYPFFQVPFNYMKIMYKLIDNGYKPIIAHPERNLYIGTDMKNLLELKNNGCLIQMNAESLLGINGNTIRMISIKMLKEHMVDFIASDAHNCMKRSPETLKKSYKKAKKLIDKDYLAEIFSNKLKVLLTTD